MTLDGRTVLREGWLTLFKSKKAGLFNSKPAPNKQLERGWAVMNGTSNPSKLPSISFYVDNRKEKHIMKREKIELSAIRGITRMFDHPKHPHCFTLKMKGSKQLILNTDTANDLEVWLKIVCDVTRIEYKREKVIWEYYDGGLWNALPDTDSFNIEGHYSNGVNTFHIEDAQVTFHYNLNNMHRTHLRTKAVHRIKRTVFIEERPEVVHRKMIDLPALWEWGEESKDQWHTFERETNIQIEDMYDSGSQWAELTLCLPSPMPFLLDLHDMKLVNFRTAVRYNLRRIDNSENVQQVSTCPQPRSPSPDFFDEPPQPNMMSPMSPLFRPLQEHLQNLQVPRQNITHKNMLGEGAFGEVFLAEVTGLPGYEKDKPAEVAVKQLRLSDFIARHGHHTQQMEDFLREAKEMAKVDHHRVMKLIAVCTLDYPLLLIEEYMNHGDLLGVLKDSRPSMPLSTQLTFAQHVADGMDYLASTLNCVHRDLAARNILVHRNEDGSMFAKVADFGLSRHLYSEMYKTQGSKPRPLPAKWMALESLMYFIFTSKSDVWSFGVFLWEIMTLGRTPYPGVENRELLEQIEERGLKLTKPKPCPSAVYDMILDCTQHQPDDRPSFTDLRSRLEECLQQLEKGELTVSVGNESVPASPAPTSSSAPTTKSSSTSNGAGEKEAEKKEEKVASEEVVKKDESEEAVKKEEKVESEEAVRKEEKETSPKGSKGTELSQEDIERMYAVVNKDHKKSKPKVSSIEERIYEDISETAPTISVLESLPSSSEGGPAQDTPVNGSEVARGTNSASVSHQEITPSGHLYYVLDPSEKSPQRKNSDSPPRLPPARSPSYSASPPPLPNHHTPSNSAKSSPAHQSNDSTHDDDIVGTRSSRLQSSPVMTSRPKSHSHSLIGRSKGGQGDVSPAKKGSSLGRIKS